jgi:hypothetical protein
MINDSLSRGIHSMMTAALECVKRIIHMEYDKQSLNLRFMDDCCFFSILNN